MKIGSSSACFCQISTYLFLNRKPCYVIILVGFSIQAFLLLSLKCAGITNIRKSRFDQLFLLFYKLARKVGVGASMSVAAVAMTH